MSRADHLIHLLRGTIPHSTLSAEEMILWLPPVSSVKAWQRQLSEIRRLPEVGKC